MDEQIIDRMCAAFADAISVTGISGIGYRAWQDTDLSIICLHEAVTEWVGGAHDGAHLVQDFAADLDPWSLLSTTLGATCSSARAQGGRFMSAAVIT